MTSVRWATFDDAGIDISEIGELAGEVAEEIINEEYDGYSAHNRDLAFAISFNLSYLTKMERWSVHADSEVDESGMLYRVWVER